MGDKSINWKKKEISKSFWVKRHLKLRINYRFQYNNSIDYSCCIIFKLHKYWYWMQTAHTHTPWFIQKDAIDSPLQKRIVIAESPWPLYIKASDYENLLNLYADFSFFLLFFDPINSFTCKWATATNTKQPILSSSLYGKFSSVVPIDRKISIVSSSG